MNRFRQRLFAWIALFAMLSGVLLPSVGQAAGAGGQGSGGIWRLEICSASGNHWIELDAAQARDFIAHAGDPASGGEAAATSGHCPWCCGHSQAAGLPPAVLPSFALPAQPGVLPVSFLPAARPLHAWATARPRAPPQAG